MNADTEHYDIDFPDSLLCALRYRGLSLINCEMVDADLAFEKSEVEATITSPVISIKNPRKGQITVQSAGQIIRDDPESSAEIIQRENSS